MLIRDKFSNPIKAEKKLECAYCQKTATRPSVSIHDSELADLPGCRALLIHRREFQFKTKYC